MEFLTLHDAVAQHVRDGDQVALEGFTHLISFAAGHEIIRQSRRNLTLIRMTPDLIYDQLIGSGATQAPHINVVVLARGLLKHLYTRVYFAGEPANAHDPVLALVPEEWRATLLAKPGAAQPNTWSIEIRLQGEAEIVFFDV